MITAKIGIRSCGATLTTTEANPLDWPELQLIDLILPTDLTGDTVNVSVCGGPPGGKWSVAHPFPSRSRSKW